MIFRIVVTNLDGSLEWELPFDSFSLTEELNLDRYAQASFNVANIKDIATTYGVTPEYIFSASYRELYIYDENDNLVYSGYISETQFSAGENDQGSIAISSKGFFSLLDRRYTSNLVVYDAEDAGAIAWDLIDTTQNESYGDIGITQGAIPTSKDRDRTFRFAQVGESIRKLSNNEVNDGFDFEVDKDKVFNVYYPEKGTKREDIVLEEGFNIYTFNVLKSFIDAMTNDVYVLGAGEGDSVIYTQRQAENIYKENFFLLQNVLVAKDVIQPTTLEDKGDNFLKLYKYPRFTISVTTDYSEPNVPNYEVGDRLRVKIPSYDIDLFYRLIKRTINNDGTVYLSFREI